MANEFHLFRGTRRSTTVGKLLARVRAELGRLSPSAPLDDLLTALLLVGGLECALTDAGTGDAALAAAITDDLSMAASGCDSGRTYDLQITRHCLQLLDSITHDGSVHVSTPEGFAYYALHPLDYSDVADRLDPERGPALVIGIRSIGTTLSAALRAKLKCRGLDADRFTVRPTGSPYERVCEFSESQRQLVARARTNGARFLVCDEGPGRSGSSLLSVAEALEREGVSANRIVIVCSHQPNTSALCTPDAAHRWLRYRSIATGMTGRTPAEAKVYAGGGEWRGRLLSRESDCPSAWPQMERLKYLSDDLQTLFTFEGYGLYGAEARARNQRLSDSEFGAEYLGHQAGFGKHHLGDGRLARASDLTPHLLRHIAHYCAWRAREFAVNDVDSAQLQDMVVTNLTREFGSCPPDFHLHIERATVCDNRMAPHHWLRANESWRKLDAAIHGDDHFFPGPCDIGWDLAGVIIEWNLTVETRDAFLAEYRCASGDDASTRIHDYEIAYTMFRLAWSRMAAPSVAGSEEEQRLTRDAGRYRRVLTELLASRGEVTRPVLSSLMPV